MSKPSKLLFIALLFAASSFAQEVESSPDQDGESSSHPAAVSESVPEESGDRIEVEEGFFGKKYFYDGTRLLQMSQFEPILVEAPEAYELFGSAKTSNIVAQILGGVGGFLIGWPIGAAVAGGEPNWTMAAIGAGVIVVSIPFSMNTSSKLERSVNKYNEGSR